MNVTTPIAPPVVSAPDTGPNKGSGATDGVDGEFSDALAGFLTDSTAQGDTDPTAGGNADTTSPDAVALAAEATASLVPAAVVPAAVALALNTPGVNAPVAGSLADEAVNGVTGTPAIPTVATGSALGGTSPEAVQLNAAASRDANAPTTATTAPVTSTTVTAGQVQEGQRTSQQPAASTAGANPQASPPSPSEAGGNTANAGDGPDVGVDLSAAARTLGLTLTNAAQPEASDPTAAVADAALAPLSTTDTTPMTAGPAPATTTTTTAQASVATLPAPAPTAPRPVHVAHQFATQLAALTGAANGVHTMTIQITPDDLGPVQVQVTLTDGVVDMNVLTALEVGRDTITQAAPDLRRYLEAAGLTCNSVEVDLNNDQSSWLSQPDAEQNFEERQPTNGREQAGTPSGDIDEPTTAPVATRSPSSTSTGVDLQM